MDGSERPTPHTRFMSSNDTAHWRDLQQLPITDSTAPSNGLSLDATDCYTVCRPRHHAPEQPPALTRERDCLRIDGVTLSRAASAVLLARVRSASAASVGEVLSIMLEHYAQVVERHGMEATFDAEDARLIARAFDDGVLRESGGMGDIGSLANGVAMEMYVEHEAADDGLAMLPETEWPAAQQALLARLRAISAGGEAAVFDRLLLAAHPSLAHLKMEVRDRATGLARSAPST